MTPRPFTVIAGFLGAGKTTLVNHLLTCADGTRYAVLVNDFGAINVDAGLIADHDGQTMALTNGCICCSLADGFVQVMLRLMETPERFDHVIVEASGVAEPGKIMDFARLDPQLSPDAIITLIDAETFSARLGDQKLADVIHQQVAQADILLLNKTDLVTGAQASNAQSAVEAINQTAPIIRCREARAPLALILGTGTGPDPKPARPAPGDPADAVFHTGTLHSKQPLDRAVFERWSEALPPEILRGKGCVSFAGEGPFLWQRVGQRMTLTPWPEDRDDTEIVLIGTVPVPLNLPGPAS